MKTYFKNKIINGDSLEELKKIPMRKWKKNAFKNWKESPIRKWK